MGVSGSGKSTIGAALAADLSVDFLDGDDLHSDANKAKMSAGVPLTDEDRLPWLRAVGKAIRAEAEAGRGIVVACSALKREYRDVLREGIDDLFFVYLAGSRELLASRLSHRSDHFMPASLLDSQLATLEPLQPDENGVVIDVDDNPVGTAQRAKAAVDANESPAQPR